MSRSLSDILSGAGGSTKVSELVSKAHYVGHSEQVFRTALPTELKDLINFANYQNGTITATAPNAVFATQLRMQQRDILNHLRRYEEFRYAYQINVKVRPVINGLSKQPNPPEISKKTGNLLAQEARLCNDEDIAAVLISLASHAK